MKMPSPICRGLLRILKTLIASRRNPDFIIGRTDEPYLLRWYVIPKNTRFNIYFHHFLRSDDDRALHDHPWWSISILLEGDYTEHMPTQVCFREEGHMGWRPATASHRIALETDLFGTELPVWTLFLTGPKVRDWGFHCPKGWKPWQEFVEPTNSGQIGKGCGDD